MNEGESNLIQWHPTFRGAVKTELEAEEGLCYLDEYALTKKELKVDLIVLDQEDHAIKNAIGHLFRKYNIMEYKSPTDYFSIDDYYKVMAYAYLYKYLQKKWIRLKWEKLRFP